MTTYNALKTAATTLCSTFASSSSPSTLLSHFSTNPPPTATEHGLPVLAPFLRTYHGVPAIRSYLELLGDTLTFRDMKFSEYVVDTQEMKVCVKGTARFVWMDTGEAWDEVFSYVLDFVKEGEDLKVVRWQVWADTGAAYLAREGRLKEVEEKAVRAGQ